MGKALSHLKNSHPHNATKNCNLIPTTRPTTKNFNAAKPKSLKNFVRLFICSKMSIRCCFMFIFQIIQSEVVKFKFEQPLDHFDHGIMGKFNQTYYVWNDNWAESDGPLFIFMGNAGRLLPENFMNSGTTVFCAVLAACKATIYSC